MINTDWFPFNADVWGNVSDWFMVVVTTITAYYIYKTLTSQTSVQEIQQRSVEIDNERYRVEHEPKFELIVDSINNKLISTSNIATIQVTLKLLKNDCRNLNILPIRGTSTIKQFGRSKNGVGGLPIPVEYLRENDSFKLSFEVSSIAQIFPYEGGYLWFNIDYEDSVGNLYRQTYFFAYQNNVTETHHGLPERIFKKSSKDKTIIERIRSVWR